MFFDIQFGKTPVDIARAKGYSDVLTALSSDQVSFNYKIPKLVHHSFKLIEMKKNWKQLSDQTNKPWTFNLPAH